MGRWARIRADQYFYHLLLTPGSYSAPRLEEVQTCSARTREGGRESWELEGQVHRTCITVSDVGKLSMVNAFVFYCIVFYCILAYYLFTFMYYFFKVGSMPRVEVNGGFNSQPRHEDPS